MTRNDLKAKYNILGDNKNISLYRKRGEFSFGVGYCGNISLVNGKAVFNGVQYKSVEDLDNALVEWEKSLPFPVDTYNPLYNERARLETRLIWYLTEKMGFTHALDGGWNDYNTYKREIGPSFHLVFQFNNRDDKVEISSRYGRVTFATVVENEEEGIHVMSTIISSSVVLMAKDMVDLISVCGDKVESEIEAYVPANNIFGVEKVGFKDLMIEKLEKVLSGLKGE